MPRGREPPPLGIREGEAPSTQVLFEDAVLFPQVGDDLKLPAIRPSRKGDMQNPPPDRVEHPPSLPANAPLAISAAEFSDSTRPLYAADGGESGALDGVRGAN